MAETAQNIEVLICTGTGGIASGSLKVADAFEAEFVKHGLEAKLGKRCDVKKTGCRGLCAKHHTRLLRQGTINKWAAPQKFSYFKKTVYSVKKNTLKKCETFQIFSK